MSDLSTVGTTVVMVAMSLGVLYLGCQIGRDAASGRAVESQQAVSRVSVP